MKPTAVFNNFRLQRCNVMMPVRCMVRRSGRWDAMGWRDLTVHDGTISPLVRAILTVGGQIKTFLNLAPFHFSRTLRQQPDYFFNLAVPNNLFARTFYGRFLIFVENSQIKKICQHGQKVNGNVEISFSQRSCFEKQAFYPLTINSGRSRSTSSETQALTVLS